MIDWIKSINGTEQKAAPGIPCIGFIAHADEHHAVQSQGRNVYTIHRQSDMPHVLRADPDTSVTIKYGRDGRVSGIEAKARSSGLGLG